MKQSSNRLAQLLLLATALLSSAASYAGDSGNFSDDYLTTGDFVIRDVTVIDGLGNKQKYHQDIFISDGNIAAITENGKQSPSSSTQVIEGKGLTAMPGLTDVHIHIKSQWHGGVVLQEKYPQDRSRKGLQKTLAAFLYSGVTIVFSVGDPTDFAVDVREKLKNGYSVGPRLHTTGMPFSQHPSGWDGAVRAETVGDPHPSELSVKIDSDDPEVLGKKLDEYVANDIKIIKIYSGASALGSKEADLLLVSGKPWENISDTRNIEYLFMKGKQVDRQKLLTSWK